MREGRPSTTAAWVAGWRGLSTYTRDAIIDDRIAEKLVPSPYRQILAAARRFAAGYDRTIPSVYVWEGVTMYLSSDAIEMAVRGVSRATKGSILLATYFLKTDAGVDAKALRWLLAQVSEPVTTTMTPDE